MNKDEDRCEGPMVAENYKGFDIWHDPIRGLYYTSHCEHTKRTRNLAELKRWLESEKRQGDPYPVK